MAGKKHEESFAQYKARLIDPISDSYCAAKWLNATIWLVMDKQLVVTTHWVIRLMQVNY